MIHLVFNLDSLDQYTGTDPKTQIFEIEADGEDGVME